MTSLKVGDLVELHPGTGQLGTGLGRGGELPALASCLLAHAAEHLHQSPTRELGTLPPEENH